MFPQATVEFPGINQVISFSGTWNHGVEPSTFVLDIAPQPANTIALYGTLRLRYGDESFEIPNCLVDSGSYQLNASGEVVSLFIKDYRWRWEYANVSGTYNVRDERGDIIDLEDDSGQFEDCLRKTKRDTTWLINRLLDSLECFSRTIDATIPEYYPECLWDYSNSARALQDLLTKLNLRLAPQLNGSVKIVSAGVGASLPMDAIETFGDEVNPQELPRRIRVVSGPIYYTVDFLLYPCTIGADKVSPVPIANPPGTPFPFNDLRKNSLLSGFSDVEDEDVRRDYAESAFKWFRVCNGKEEYPGKGEITQVPATALFGNLNPITIPDNGAGEPLELEFGWAFPDIGPEFNHHITFLSQFEIQDFCCERLIENEIVNGKASESAPFRKPFVWGAFYRESDGTKDDEFANENSISSIDEILQEKVSKLSYLKKGDETDLRRVICPVQFVVDRSLGLVRFSSQVYLKNDGDSSFFDSEEIQWPELALRCAIRVKNKATGNWIRRERVRELDPSSPAKEIVYHLDDVNVYYEIDGSSNLAEVNRLMDEFINTIHANLTRRMDSATATYAKWFRFELDGAIQSISWAIGQGGAKMTISRNIDNGSSTAMEYDLRLRKTTFKKTSDWIARNELKAKREELGLD